MYREVLRRQVALQSASKHKAASSWYRLPHRPSTSRYLSTPTPPPNVGQEVPPATTSPTPTREQEHVQSGAASQFSSSSPEQALPPPQTDADKLAQFQAQFRELTHETVRRMRERGDQFTVQVARTFAQFGRELNRVTGYEEIEALKRRVVEQGASAAVFGFALAHTSTSPPQCIRHIEARINNAREAARQAKEAYDRAVLQRAKSQREVNDLLQRKSHWTDEDVSRFTTLVREDHAREHDESRAKVAAAVAEDAVEREFSELMRVILNRYHEEQAWSDKIRSASTYGSLAALALNMAVFVLAIVLVEPWKRRRLAQTFERKVEEMNAATAAAFESTTGELKHRLDEQGRLLSLVLETVHLTTQVSNSELASLGVDEEEAPPTSAPSPPPTWNSRIPGVTKPEQELLIAATAGAAVAGLVGWLARSWYG
ncbi:Mdm33 family-domain-containing protein [Trametes meyenii]|nr:Mdm33 family-domain-containing protein [Trametes meyenii]